VRLLWVGLLTGLVATPLWSNDVWRSVDAQGNVRYSDRPEGENVEKVVISLPRGSASPGTRQAATPAPVPEAQAPAPAASAPAEPAPDDAEQRARNCEIATERMERYSVSQRLYRTLPDGEREYLNDAETDDARARAAAEVERWCAP